MTPQPRRKNKLIRMKIIEVLKVFGDLNTLDIRDYMNENTRRGTTMSELGNVLGKDPIFLKVGSERIQSCASRQNGTYKVFVWRLNPAYQG